MKIHRLLIALLAIAFAVPGLAQQDISGTWTGNLPVGPDTTLEIHFVLSRDGDGYSAVLTSPDPNGIQDIAANSASFDGSVLTLTVDALSGRYEGTLQNGSFAGNWSQQGQQIPLNLSPFVERELSDADKRLVGGSWVGELSVQGVTLAIVFRFENDETGEFVGFLDSPDQGANGIPVANIQVVDGELRFAIPQIGGDYTGKVEADTMTGTFRQLGQPLPLNMTRGEFVQRGLELSDEAISRLEGSWVGSVQNGSGGSLTIVFRFERTEGGGVAGFLDSPDQGANGIPIGEVSLDGDQLALVISAARASFTATLGADSMTGNWAQGNQAQPVTMTRGEYTPSATALDLSDDAYAQLAGAWSGEMGPLEIIFRFETTADGTRVGYLDVPAQGAAGLTISEAALEGDQVTIRIGAAGAVYSGTLSAGQIVGTWAQGPANNPLTVTRRQ